jgi:capsular polysaccharide biosynthesis protein
VDRQETIAILQAALFDFENGRYTAVIERLESESPEQGGFGPALILASRGLLLERSGDVAGAGPLMERAFDHGVTVPSLLDVLQEFFRRTGRLALANHAFLLGQLVWPLSDPPEVGWVREVAPEERALYVPWAMRASPWAATGDMLGLAPFKRALVSQLGPDGAAIVLSRMRRGFAPRRPRRRQLVSFVDHARTYGYERDELVAGGPDGLSAADPEHGQPVAYERYVLPFITCLLDEVIVHARSAVLLTGDRALLDVDEDVLRHRPGDLGVDPVVVSALDGELVILEPFGDDIEVMDQAISLTGVHSPAFGHWMMEFLPKIWALMDREGFSDVPVLVDEGMPDQHLEALRCFIGDDQPVRILRRDECVRVRRLWTASALEYLPIGPLPLPRIEEAGVTPRVLRVDEGGIRKLVDRALSVLGPFDDEDTPRRIYLARTSTQRRRLLDAAEIESILAAHGYVAIDFAGLTFREQLRLMRGATHVVAAAGSAALMTMFAPPGLQLIVLTPEWTEAGFVWRASQALQHDITVLIGKIPNEHPEYRWQSDYEIDPAELLAALTRSR